MPDAAFSAEQYFRHGNPVTTLFRHEDFGMAVGAIQPFQVLPVGVDHVGHRAFHFAHDVEIHQQRLFARVGQVPRGSTTFFVSDLTQSTPLPPLLFGFGSFAADVVGRMGIDPAPKSNPDTA